MADLHLGAQVDPASHARIDAATIVRSGDLTTHAVIVGMTGSGKTGLGVVLIEEAIRAGIPTLAIDPKGDLTNLRLVFPELRADDFEPWVNPDDARSAGTTVPEFAAKQAEQWRQGLAGWDLGPAEMAALRDGAEFTIYTPGSTAGTPLNVVGSLEAPPAPHDDETIAAEIEGYVTGLLALVDIDADPLSSREHILLSNLIHAAWSEQRDLDLPALIGMVSNPPMRKLGVFELDAFFPPADRMKLAVRLNGLLASPSFAAWMQGDPIDIGSMLRTADGRPRCAIVTTAHLSDAERQFVTSIVLAKLITWMRRQTGTTDLRTLVYMDEVAGYVPPTAMPPTKKPIMTLMKQARAFGVGVALTTQNPVDVDYKAISNAGTWIIGRLQTERDKQRLLDGMTAAAGGVDVAALGATIGGLAKREFVLRRAGKDAPEVFTTRWAMSYLRGPMTKDQIARLRAASDAPGAADAARPVAAADPPTAAPIPDDAVSLMPEVAAGVEVRWVDPAAPWVAAVGGSPSGRILAPAIVCRVALRYDDDAADLVHDEEYEAVVHPLGATLAAGSTVAVDHDDRDLLTAAPAGAAYRLGDAALAKKATWTAFEKQLVDELVRSRSLTILANRKLRLYSRPGETGEAFGTRCLQAANDAADADIATLRDKYESKARTLRDQLRAAEDRVDVLRSQQKGRESEELLSTAGSILGGLLGGRSRGSILGKIAKQAGSAAGRRSRTSTAGKRTDAAENKAESIRERIDALEADLADDLTAIDRKWMATAKEISQLDVRLERTDVRVTSMVLAWLPVA